jgi:hypothetical protein
VNQNIVTSGARTTSGNSGPIGMPERTSVNLAVNVTAVSGTTPNMALTVEWSNDATTWYKGDPADAFTALTATGAVVKNLTAKGAYARLVWTLTGTTPSFTFTSDMHWADRL